VALTAAPGLPWVAGLTTAQIAPAFLAGEAAMARRLVRARRKVRAGLERRRAASADHH
jgi:predicted RNA polymerase sigma factor